MRFGHAQLARLSARLQHPLFATETQLDSLRGDARFVAFMARLERDWQERKRTL